ncbi:hypothetical protein CEXT_247441 [Caerostris extrusa]|uniref:Uncharacterized protein n=1 Tax=Caerostris extrusa TaxID=172846 RepID=A0AAV4XXF2_CAEEX|nr:hypothetical protein CEXT_247441 [Caerostris extrusa]
MKTVGSDVEFCMASGVIQLYLLLQRYKEQRMGRMKCGLCHGVQKISVYSWVDVNTNSAKQMGSNSLGM